MTGVTPGIAKVKSENEFDFKNKKLPVIELFGPTIQGEGALAGKRSHFLRLGGCTYRCAWCDSMHAVDPVQVKKNAKWLTPAEIVKQVEELPPGGWITLTGGDPAQHNLHELIRSMPLHLSVAVETQGAIFPTWLQICDLVTISPKPPSSDMKPDMEILDRGIKMLENFNTWHVLKVVVFTQEDYVFARDLHLKYPEVGFYLSVGTRHEAIRFTGDSLETRDLRDEVCSSYKKLCEHVLTDAAMVDVTVLPQLHYLMWGSEKGR